MPRSRSLFWGIIGLMAFAACGPMPASFTVTPPSQAADSVVVRAIADEARIDPDTFPPMSVGVLPLRVVSSDPTLQPLGYGLAELLMGDLARSSAVQVVDRIRIHSVMRELELGQSEVIQASGAPRVGRIMGARNLVLGEIATADPSSVLISTNLARTEDATLQSVSAGTATLDEIIEAEKQIAFSVFPALGVTLTPAERAAIEARPTRSLGALLAFSRGVQAEAERQFGTALQEYREAVRLDSDFQEPRERIGSLEVYFPDMAGVAAIMIDAINRPGPPDLGDVNEPAFKGRSTAVLIIPITIP